MLRKLLWFAGALLLALVALAFGYFAWLLITEAVLPQLQSYQILNIHWRGNALLIPVGVYLLIAVASIWGSWRLLRHCLRPEYNR